MDCEWVFDCESLFAHYCIPTLGIIRKIRKWIWKEVMGSFVGAIVIEWYGVPGYVLRVRARWGVYQEEDLWVSYERRVDIE